MKKDNIEKRNLIQLIRQTYEGALKSSEESPFPYMDDYDDVVKKLGKAIYSRQIQFILELIQNAEDNHYNGKIIPELIFNLKPEKLILQNNEIGFKKENVRAICRVGINATTKLNLMGYIGEKGIGFKSIFTISDFPEIHSNGYHFKFNKKEKLGLINPTWIEEIPHEDIDLSYTNFIIPYTSEEIHQEVLRDFDKLSPEILLFLNKIQRIEIKGEINRIIEKSIIDNSVKINDKYWKIFKKSFLIPLEIVKEDKRKNVIETEIILAFPLDDKGDVNSSISTPIYAYFPTRAYGLKFIVQADFQTILNREDIEKDNKWNKWLIKSLKETMILSIEEFKKDQALKYQFYDYLPFPDDLIELINEENPFINFVIDLQGELTETNYILTENDNWAKPHEVKFIDPELRTIFPKPSDFKHIYNLDYEFLHPEIRKKFNKTFLRSLGIEELSFKDFCKLLDNVDWLSKQNFDWFLETYKKILRKFESILKKGNYSDEFKKFISLKLFKHSDGKLYCINSGIYLGIKYPNYGFEKKFLILPNIYEKSYEKDPEIKEFFDIFNISRIGKKEIDKFLDHLYFWKLEEKLYGFEENSPKRWIKEDPEFLIKTVLYLKDTRSKIKHLWVKTKNNDYVNIEKNLGIIFLPSEYSESEKLEVLLKDTQIQHYFLSPDYINADITLNKHNINDKNLKEEWVNFLSKYSITGNFIISHYHFHKNATPPRNFSAFRDKFESEFREKSLLSFTHDEIDEIPDQKFSHHRIYDYNNEIMVELINFIKVKKDIEKAKLFLFHVNSLSGDSYKNYRKFEGSYYKQSKTIKLGYSSWIRHIKDSKIFPTKHGLKKSSEVFSFTEELSKIFEDLIPSLLLNFKAKKAFLDIFDIKRGIDINSIIFLLTEIKESRKYSKNSFEKIYTYFFKHMPLEQAEELRDKFNSNKLIHINNNYFGPEELIWEDRHKIIDKNSEYRPLTELYPNLKEFFVLILKVPEFDNPNLYKYRLMEISGYDKVKIDDSIRNIIFKIYELINEKLKYYDLDWLTDIKYLVSTNRVISFLESTSNNPIYINDNVNLYNLFKEQENIIYLEIPYGSIPKYNRFIKQNDFKYLSKSIKKELYDPKKRVAKNLKGLSEKLSSYIQYIENYLYWKNHEFFIECMKKKKFKRFKEISCFELEDLEINNSFKINPTTELTVITKESILYDDNENIVYIDKMLSIRDESQEFKHQLAKIIAEIFKYDHLTDFIIVLFSLGSHSEIENYMIMRGLNLKSVEKIFNELEEEAQEITEQKIEALIIQNSIENQNLSEILEEEGVLHQNSDHLNFEGSSLETKFEPESEPANAIGTEIKHIKPPELEPKLIPIPDKSIKLTIKKKQIKKERIIKETRKTRTNRTEIGKWGEEKALGILREIKEEQYGIYINPDFELTDTSQGFKIDNGENTIFEAIWVNKYGEKRPIPYPYDIYFVENGDHYFIEVKATTSRGKDWFDITENEWNVLITKGDHYFIYRIYKTGKKEFDYEIIKNPSKQWKDGDIIAIPSKIML